MATVLIAYLRNDEQNRTVKVRVPSESFARKYEAHGWRLIDCRRVEARRKDRG